MEAKPIPNNAQLVIKRLLGSSYFVYDDGGSGLLVSLPGYLLSSIFSPLPISYKERL